MWTQIYDLHSHSLHSDGEHPVDRVAELMHAEGVRLLGTHRPRHHFRLEGGVHSSHIPRDDLRPGCRNYLRTGSAR